jgi:hypothetical protein
LAQVILAEFLAAEDSLAAAQARDLILDALTVLEHHPQSGYFARYQYPEADDLAVLLALRHQREAGYPDR